MRLVNEPRDDQRYLYLHDPEVKGVELDGLDELNELATRLGAYASHELTTTLRLNPESGAEALTLQAQLLREAARSTVAEDAPFVFRAPDGHAAQVLKRAVQMSEDDVAEVAVRPPWRFLPKIPQIYEMADQGGQNIEIKKIRDPQLILNNKKGIPSVSSRTPSRWLDKPLDKIRHPYK